LSKRSSHEGSGVGLTVRGAEGLHGHVDIDVGVDLASGDPPRLDPARTRRRKLVHQIRSCHGQWHQRLSDSLDVTQGAIFERQVRVARHLRPPAFHARRVAPA